MLCKVKSNEQYMVIDAHAKPTPQREGESDDDYKIRVYDEMVAEHEAMFPQAYGK
jgi:hypothetical protein